MPNNKIPHPKPFIKIRVNRLDIYPPIVAACAGYELGKWRKKQLSKHLLQWLPEFALKFTEWRDLSASDAVAKIGTAAQSIYKSDQYENRGELGEILLHVILRQHFGSIPAIAKFYFKDSRNDTVKGFDAVHVVSYGSDLELWLGEVKFYSEINRAIRDSIEEIVEHFAPQYLREEFIAINNKIDENWPDAQRLRDLLDGNRSLDEIFSEICVPVLLTYNSDTISHHDAVTAQYVEEFEKEVLKYRTKFEDKLPLLPMRIHLCLFPLENKIDLVREWDEHLRRCQSLI
jgi:hypothetical protein